MPVTVKNGDSPPESLNIVKRPIITEKFINRDNNLSCQINSNDNCINVDNNSNRQSLCITNDSNFYEHQLNQAYLQYNQPETDISLPKEDNYLTLLNSREPLLVSKNEGNLNDTFNISQGAIDKPLINKLTADKGMYYTSPTMLNEYNRNVMYNVMENGIQPGNFEATTTLSNRRICNDDPNFNLNHYDNQLHSLNKYDNHHCNTSNNNNNINNFGDNQNYLHTPKNQQESHQHRHYMATNSSKVCHYYRCDSNTLSSKTVLQSSNTIDKITIQHSLLEKKVPQIDERFKIFSNSAMDSKMSCDTSDAAFSVLSDTLSSSTLPIPPPPPPPPPPVQSGTQLLQISNANSVCTSVPYRISDITANRGCINKDNNKSYIQFAASFPANSISKNIKDGNLIDITGKLDGKLVDNSFCLKTLQIKKISLKAYLS